MRACVRAFPKEYERKAEIVKKESGATKTSALAARLVRMLKDDDPPQVWRVSCLLDRVTELYDAGVG